VIGHIKAKWKNLRNPDHPSPGIPYYLVCDECGKAVRHDERWRSGVSMPDTPTRTLCDSCEEVEQ